MPGASWIWQLPIPKLPSSGSIGYALIKQPQLTRKNFFIVSVIHSNVRSSKCKSWKCKLNKNYEKKKKKRTDAKWVAVNIHYVRSRYQLKSAEFVLSSFCVNALRKMYGFIFCIYKKKWRPKRKLIDHWSNLILKQKHNNLYKKASKYFFIKLPMVFIKSSKKAWKTR